MKLNTKFVRECFSYNFELGYLVWKQRPWHHYKSNKRQKISLIGTRAGSLHHKGRRVISLDGKQYQEHRLIFLWFHGYSPVLIAHWDGDKTNNKISNLLDSTNADNSKFLSKHHQNTSGHTGVRFNIARKKWLASIKVNKKQIDLGAYSTKEEAIKARKEAETKYGFHKDHGTTLKERTS